MNQFIYHYVDKLLSQYSEFWQMVLIAFAWAAIIFFQVKLKEIWTEGPFVVHKKDHPYYYHFMITLESFILYLFIVWIIADHRELVK